MTKIKKTKIVMTLGILLILVVGGLWITGESTTGEVVKETTIKIGVVGPLTGFGAYHGNQEVKGLQVAQEQINKQGGINNKQVELIIEDSQAQNTMAVTAVRRLIDVENVKFIIGDAWSSTTGVMVPITNQAEVILLSPIAILDELTADDYFFRTVPPTKEMMKQLAEYAYDEMGARRVAVLKANAVFGVEHTEDFRVEFEKLGGKIVAVEDIDLSQVDVRTELTKIKKSNPDTIFNIHTSGPKLGIVMKQAEELGLDVNWLGTFGAENDPLITQFPEVSQGLTYPYPYDKQAEQESVKTFIKLYKAKYNEIPDLTAANAYDSLMLLKQAIETVGENPDSVKQYLLQVEDYQGASGTLSFDKYGDVEKPILIKQIQNQEFVRVD